MYKITRSTEKRETKSALSKHTLRYLPTTTKTTGDGRLLISLFNFQYCRNTWLSVIEIRVKLLLLQVSIILFQTTGQKLKIIQLRVYQAILCHIHSKRTKLRAISHANSAFAFYRDIPAKFGPI